jgi:ABC-2 type transport system permease protein
MSKSRGGLRLAVVDQSGRVSEALRREVDTAKTRDQGPKVDLHLEAVRPAADPAAQRAALDARVLRDEIDAWLWIPPGVFADNRVEYHGATLSNILTLEVLERSLTRVVRERRLADAGYDPQQIEKLVAGVDLEKQRVTQEGSKPDQGLGDFFLAIGLFIALYTTVMIYGQMVMQGILEEKGNRIVEVVASAARPTQLMAGKLIGICGVALTQIGVWAVSAAALTAPGLLGRMAAATGDGTGMRLPSLSPVVLVHFVALFLLGFVIYASFFALVGAAFNNAQEAQQLVSLATIFLVAPFVFFMPVLNDPDGKLAVVTSLIPFFTPTVMMLRIAIKVPPAWQLLVGYAGALLAAAAMVWVCARVYRVGILMYGKKPSLKEIWRWTRYA